MRKVIFLFSSLLISFLFFVSWNNKAYAENCPLSIDRTTPFPLDFNEDIVIKGNCFTSGKTYTILGYPSKIDPSPGEYFKYSIDTRQYSDPNSITARLNLTKPTFYPIGSLNPGPWIIKVCTQDVLPQCGETGRIVGTININVSAVSAVSAPTPTPIPSNLPKVAMFPSRCKYQSDESLELTLSDLLPKTTYRWWWWQPGIFQGGDIAARAFTTYQQNGTVAKATIEGKETQPTGSRTLCVDVEGFGVARCIPGSQNSATLQFTFGPPPVDGSACVTTAAGGQVPQNIPTPTPIIPTPICAKGAITPIKESVNSTNVIGYTCSAVDTGLGIDIKTNPEDLVKSVFGIILSLSGGIALILIIISGYQLIFSQGNPEQVKAAQEQLTSAVVGLLFIIFSLVILQIIGADILKIPGFK
ncbi:MAG: hypothetical protein Q7R31_01860 [Candidatus Levybacteria bacterium]|nr:hypothetical protein [Candidatus Levybacteria bacterium]